MYRNHVPCTADCRIIQLCFFLAEKIRNIFILLTFNRGRAPAVIANRYTDVICKISFMLRRKSCPPSSYLSHDKLVVIACYFSVAASVSTTAHITLGDRWLTSIAMWLALKSYSSATNLKIQSRENSTGQTNNMRHFILREEPKNKIRLT